MKRSVKGAECFGQTLNSRADASVVEHVPSESELVSFLENDRADTLVIENRTPSGIVIGYRIIEKTPETRKKLNYVLPQGILGKIYAVLDRFGLTINKKNARVEIGDAANEIYRDDQAGLLENVIESYRLDSAHLTLRSA